jgi:hypothetical protein
MAAQDAARDVRGMLGSEHAPLAKRLEQQGDEARETKQEASDMRDAYLGGEDDPLDGFGFLAMADEDPFEEE